MKKLIFTVFLSFSLLNVFSQNSEMAVDFSRYGSPITGASYINRTVVKDLIHELERINRSKTPEELDEAFLNSIVGTPFMNNKFAEGALFTNENKKLDKVFLRFNVFNNKMEVKFNESLFELSEELIKRVTIDDKTFEFLPYKIAEKSQSGYLELIHEDEWKIYCYHSKKYIEAQPQKAMQDKPSPPEFNDLPLVYLLKKSQKSQAIGFRSKKELVNIFSNNKNEILAYIKKHKLKHNNPEDLKELLTYFNTL